MWYPEPTATELVFDEQRYAIGISTTESVRLHGFHSENLLVIVDEARGIRQEIWDGIDSILSSGNARLLLLGNPTAPGGPYYEAFTRNRRDWRTITISAFDTPNLEGLTVEGLLALDGDELDRNPVPYLISRRWARDYVKRWGREHPKVQARVFGEFPSELPGTLVPLALIERAATDSAEPPRGAKYAGVDVAGPGEDETVLVVRQGGEIIEITGFSEADARGPVIQALAAHKRDLVAVNVDSIGIGWYFARALEDAGFPVQEINVGTAAVDPDGFANLKAELYWYLRERFQGDEIHGLVDDEMQGQLSDIRYSHNGRGQTVIESKEDMRKRGSPSPDRAEALMLAFAPTIARETRETLVYDEGARISRY